MNYLYCLYFKYLYHDNANIEWGNVLLSHFLLRYFLINLIKYILMNST